jgi:hypothetical protein
MTSREQAQEICHEKQVSQTIPQDNGGFRHWPIRFAFPSCVGTENTYSTDRASAFGVQLLERPAS